MVERYLIQTLVAGSEELERSLNPTKKDHGGKPKGCADKVSIGWL
jgi:hypothetical protein